MKQKEIVYYDWYIKLSAESQAWLTNFISILSFHALDIGDADFPLHVNGAIPSLDWYKYFLVDAKKEGVCLSQIGTDVTKLEKLDSILLNVLRNISDFSFGFNLISDLTPVGELVNLQKLDCCSNKIRNLEPLCALSELKYLNLNSNYVKDLSPLRTLLNLEYLDCSCNQISDLGPLFGLIKLKKLRLYNNPITDFALLDDLPDLEVVTVDYGEVPF